MIYYVLIVMLSLNSNIADTSTLSETHEARFVADAIIRQLFEMFRRLFVNGDSNKGMPSMDPMIIEYGELEYAGKTLKCISKFSNGSISGLGAFRLNQSELDKDRLSVKLDVEIPSVVIDAENYNLFGDIMEAVPLKGLGHFHIELQNITLCGNLYLKQSEDGKSILLERLENAYFTVDQVSSRTDFDGNIDDILNAIIGDVFAKYITASNGLILQNYSDTIIQLLNTYLSQYETWRVLAVIL